MKNVLKKIGSVLVDVLIVVVFIISTLVVIASVTANRTGGQPSIFGYVFSSVQTDSMEPTINKGDFVVGKLVDDSTEINVGDIISFEDFYEGEKIIVTHRVVEVYEEKPHNAYVTQGDNEKHPDVVLRSWSAVKSVYQFKIPFLGGFIDFLKTPFGFIICLVIPLLAFIAWQAYKLISLYLKVKKLELAEEAQGASNSDDTSNTTNTANTKSELTEEEKNAIIAEYLAKQRALENKQGEDLADSDNEKTDAPAEDVEKTDAVADDVEKTEDAPAEEVSTEKSEDNTEEGSATDEDGDKN